MNMVLITHIYILYYIHVYSPKVKKNKMASYWQKTTTGAPPLKIDEKVSFRGYGAATTAALDTSNRSTSGSNKGSGGNNNNNGETPPPDVKAGGGMTTLAPPSSVGKPEEEEGDGEDFRSKVVKLVRQGTLSPSVFCSSFCCETPAKK